MILLREIKKAFKRKKSPCPACESPPAKKSSRPPEWLKAFVIYPVTWRHILVGAAVTQLVAPLTGTLFRRGSEAVAEYGIDPAVVGTLAPGKTVHVARQRSGLAEKLQQAAEMANLPHILNNFITDADRNTSYSIRFRFLRRFCNVHPNKMEGLPLEQDVISDLPASRIRKDFPVTRREIDAVVLLHEITHCSGADEDEADWQGMTIAARELKNPEIIRFYFNRRAVYQADMLNRFIGDSHDTTLYLDAKMRGRAPPTWAERRAANAEAGAFIRSGALMAWSEIPKDLSPLARRRVELYVEALRYFVPPPEAPAKPHMQTLERAPPKGERR
jgi:hypothetical protein